MGKLCISLNYFFLSIGPDMQIVHSDMNKFKSDVDSLNTKLSVMGDPQRFSCAVTTDEIRTPGAVILI